MSSPPIAVAGCIHDTYPMMATCTPIQTRTTVPAVNALVRAMRERTKTATAAQARTVQNLGDRPLVVVTAARDALAGWLPLQDRMATPSTNSSHRVVPYPHVALVTEYNAAQASSRAICDVVHPCGSLYL